MICIYSSNNNKSRDPFSTTLRESNTRNRSSVLEMLAHPRVSLIRNVESGSRTMSITDRLLRMYTCLVAWAYVLRVLFRLLTLALLFVMFSSTRLLQSYDGVQEQEFPSGAYYDVEIPDDQE